MINPDRINEAIRNAKIIGRAEGREEMRELVLGLVDELVETFDELLSGASVATYHSRDTSLQEARLLRDGIAALPTDLAIPQPAGEPETWQDCGCGMGKDCMRATKIIRQVEEDHRDAAGSTLVFGEPVNGAKVCQWEQIRTTKFYKAPCRDGMQGIWLLQPPVSGDECPYCGLPIATKEGE